MNPHVCSKWYEDCHKLLTSYYNTIWLYSFRMCDMRKVVIDIDILDDILLTLFNYSLIRHSQKFSILLLFHSVYHNRFPWTIMCVDWSMQFDLTAKSTILKINVGYFLYTLLLLYIVEMKSRDKAKSAVNWYIVVTRRYIREWVRETDTLWYPKECHICTTHALISS